MAWTCNTCMGESNFHGIQDVHVSLILEGGICLHACMLACMLACLPACLEYWNTVILARMSLEFVLECV